MQSTQPLTEYTYPDKHDAITVDLIGCSEPYKGYWQKSEDGVLKQMFRKLDKGNRNYRLLDAGCGYGRLILQFNEYFKEIDGVEPDFERYQVCRQNIEKWKLEHKVTLYNKQAENMNKENYYDVILCSHVIQHISEQETVQLLKAFRRMLKKDGMLFITTTHSTDGETRYAKSYLDRFGKRMEEYIRQNEFNRIENQKGILPVKFFTYSNIGSILSNCNFKLEDYRVYHHRKGHKLLDKLIGTDRFINSSIRSKAKNGRDLYACAIPK